MALSLDLMPLEEKPPEPLPAKTIVVRYGYLKQIGEYPSDVTAKIGCGTKLVCRTDRGTEITEMLTTTCSNGGCGKSVTREKMLEYFDNSGGQDYPFSAEGRVLRIATIQDLAEQERLNESRKKDVAFARDLVVHHRLQMKIVEVEYLLGRERVIFYFTSEHRIDFRQLVRDMAHQLHARIELRQVGARDEARITADYEKCGQHCCCKQFLKVLTPISMRSAKIQKATLDPAKISGRCGRLMCCLRYEDQTYEELRKKLPKRNTRVRTEQGEAWVVDGQILTQLILVQYDDGKRTAVAMEAIQAFDLPKPKLPNGVTMQSPNDRMPEPRLDAPGRAGPGAPPGPGGPRRAPGPIAPNAPQGGPPAQAGAASASGPAPRNAPPQANPRSAPKPGQPREGQFRGPPLPASPGTRPGKAPPRLPDRPGNPNAAPAAQPPIDDLDDLIADAMDSIPISPSAPSPTAGISAPPAIDTTMPPAPLTSPSLEAPKSYVPSEPPPPAADAASENNPS